MLVKINFLINNAKMGLIDAHLFSVVKFINALQYFVDARIIGIA
ncbi:MAG: hypothetical protein K0R71_284 [Bacillales bacterium]|jgi:hypothetical protein|nr:hypothetical protein [Bacillales bacterium]